MKHFKLWCLILAIFVGLSAILLIGRSEKKSRSIASIESSKALSGQLEQLIAQAKDQNLSEVEVQSQNLMEKIELATSQSSQEVDSIYRRGQEILEEVEHLTTFDQLEGVNGEISELQDQLDLQKQELEILTTLVSKASSQHDALRTPLADIKERLITAQNKIEKAYNKIAEIEKAKPAVIEKIEDKLLVAQSDEIERLKNRNCDMELTICRQKDELTKLREDVEKLLVDKEEVVEEVEETNLFQSPIGMFTLMLQTQLNMMTAMMNNFSLYYPRVSQTPFSNSDMTVTTPRYNFNLFENIFNYNNFNYGNYQLPQTASKKKQLSFQKDTLETPEEVITDPEVQVSDAAELSDEDITASIDNEFKAIERTPSRWDIEAKDSFSFN